MRLPVAVLGLLSVAPRVSQRQEQQQRTQALAQLPPRRSSPARRWRHHQGRSRLLPGARVLSPPCTRLLRGHGPSPRQGAPENRGVCATCAGHWGRACCGAGGIRRSWGAECKQRRQAGDRGAWPRSRVAGSGLSRPGWSHRVDRFAGLGVGPRPPSCLFLGEEHRVRKAGGCSHFTPGSHAQEEEEEPEPVLTPGKRRGSRGVNKLPSCCQLISKDQGQDNVCFSASSVCTVLPTPQFSLS